jgi:deoxyribonuclease-4
MLLGAHISAAGGLFNAPLNAKKMGCEIFQFFSRSPQGGKASVITPEVLKLWNENLKLAKIKTCYIHTSYYINLASADNRLRHFSIAIIKEELERASKLKVTAVMTHLGSDKGGDRNEAIKRVADSVAKILTNYKGSAQFLFENSAGSGGVIGADFAELGKIIKLLPKPLQTKVGICLDTCHAFASGYDFRTVEAVKKTVLAFKKHLGLKRLKLIHLNDSLKAFDSRVDRHALLGKGLIGLKGMQAIFNNPDLKKINMIMETPGTDEERTNDLKTAFKLRKSKK